MQNGSADSAGPDLPWAEMFWEGGIKSTSGGPNMRRRDESFLCSSGFRAWRKGRFCLFLCTLASLVAAQPSFNDTTAVSTNGPAATVDDPAENAWSFSASAYFYLVPDSRDYVQPTFTADRDWLHLEARYNYEDLETGSVWVGYNFSGGGKVSWDFTPMLGGVFGETTGIAPGYEGSVSWWKLELYSEGEYVVDVGDSSGSFFYSWSELTLAPVGWFRFGLVAQRTRAYETDREVQRGLLAGVTYKQLDFTAYAFNPDESKPIIVLAVGVTF